jgi:hypothetical protein
MLNWNGGSDSGPVTRNRRITPLTHRDAQQLGDPRVRQWLRGRNRRDVVLPDLLPDAEGKE